MSLGALFLSWDCALKELVEEHIFGSANPVHEDQDHLPSWMGQQCLYTPPTHGDSLFALDNGLIGVMPGPVAPGDKIVATPCADDTTSPFLVVRPDSDGLCTFRGLAYMHGRTHLEYWRGWHGLDAMFENFGVI